MQLVIEIDEELYNYMQTENYDKHLDKRFDFQSRFAIKHGTPLPEGHGNLIDSSYLLNILKCDEYETCPWRWCEECDRVKCIRKRNILDAPIIVAADKGGKANED